MRLPGIRPYRVVIFDLDDTLYNERDYLFPAYEKIAETLAKETQTPAEHLRNFLVDTFETEGRSELFNKLRTHFRLPEESLSISINILRKFDLPAPLHLKPGVKELIDIMKQEGIRFYILTNGHKIQQQNKIRQIDWQGLLQHFSIVFAAEHQPKPGTAGIRHIMMDSGFTGSDILFIGDAAGDRECAAAAGIQFLQVDKAIEVLHQYRNF